MIFVVDSIDDILVGLLEMSCNFIAKVIKLCNWNNNPLFYVWFLIELHNRVNNKLVK